MPNTVPTADDGQWISGPMIDRRPEYSPASLILDVRQLLHRAGVEVDPGPSELHVASLAAADLLRALGVRPANAPQR